VEGYTLTQRPLAAKRGPSRLLRLATDERLVTLTRRGDQAAFEVLVARYQARLLTFCRHILRSREDAEDILQDVFAAAFNALLADEREINVRPWLYRIARNRCLNHMRRRSAIGVDSMDIHFADMGISTGEKVFKREEFRTLVEDIGRLPETQRTALLLREMDGLSYEQVAHAMETTVPGVKSLLVRARIGLAEAAEARKLSCVDVRVELGAVAEGIASLTQPVRHHLKDCERCRDFRTHLRANNRALAALAPFGPLLLLKKLLVTKLGAGAGAGGAGGPPTRGGGAGGGGAGPTAGGGAVAAATAGGTASIAGAGTAGAFTATAVATKAIAGIAAAALLTVGAVASDHSHPVSLARPQAAAAAPAHATVSRSGSLHARRLAHMPKVAVASIAAPATMTMPTVAPNATPLVAATVPATVPATAPATPTTEEVTTTTVFPGSTATGPSGVTVGGVTGTSGSTATTGASGTTAGATGASGTTATSGTTGTSGTTTGASGASGATGNF
jgi:RNA polymerase sigma factor (sigma-70 family)